MDMKSSRRVEKTIKISLIFIYRDRGFFCVGTLARVLRKKALALQWWRCGRNKSGGRDDDDDDEIDCKNYCARPKKGGVKLGYINGEIDIYEDPVKQGEFEGAIGDG